MTESWPGRGSRKSLPKVVAKGARRVRRMGDTARYILKTAKDSVGLKLQVTMAKKETREVRWSRL